MALSETQKSDLLSNLGSIKRFCRSMTSSASDADDLLQLTVERLLVRGVPADADIAKWAYKVCRNLWLDELRSREVRSRHAAGEIAANGDTVMADSNEIEALELERTARAMQKLPEQQRSALLLVAVEGCSYAEVADILDIPIGTVMSRVARARRQLAEFME